MNYLDTAKRTQIVNCLVEGVSIRATCRMTGAAKATVLKLLVDLGEVCAAYQNEHLRNLPCKRVQVDEIWAFCYSKEKNVPDEFKGVFGVGDVWTWTAICADTKIVPCWHLGSRDGVAAGIFIDDLRKRLKHRIQLTSDGLKSYLQAVEDAWGGAVDYAQLIKLYGEPAHADNSNIRYSPAVCTGTKVVVVEGNPDRKHVSTSYVERQNLTMRMHMRRFTRLTNAFSKKVENHGHALAIYFMHYNFCRIHQTLRTSPAMAAGVETRLWEVADLVKLLEQAEAEKEAALGPRRTRGKGAKAEDGSN